MEQTTSLSTGTTVRTRLALLAISIGGVAACALLLVLFRFATTTHSLPSVTKTVTLNFPDVVQTAVTQDGTTYQKLSLPQETTATNTTPGTPQIPYLKQQFAIPEQAVNIRVHAVVNGTPNIYPDVVVYPVPQPTPKKDAKGLSYVEDVFTKNDTAYQQNSFLPNTYVSIVSDRHFRSQRLVELAVNPLWYNPASQTLQEVSHLTVTLTYDLNNSVKSKANKLGSTTALAKAMVANPTDVVAAPAAAEQTSTIITDIALISGGSGYTSTPAVTISGGGGSGATATVIITNKIITAITVTNHGNGYTSTPAVTISGGGGSGAMAIASLTGSVTYLSATQLHTPPTYIDYLLVTDSSYAGTELADFANYRATMDNLHVGVAYISDIYSQFPGTAPDQQLKDFVTNAYTVWPQPAPVYLLLVGDPDIGSGYIPVHSVTSTRYDLGDTYTDTSEPDSWYVDVNTDGHPDLAVGRFAIASKTEVQNITNKIKCYESSTLCPGDWRTQTSTMDTSDFSAATIGSELASTVGFGGDTLCWNGGTMLYSYAALIQGNFFAHESHGNYQSTYCMEEEALDQYLVNTNQTPVMFVSSCNTADFSNHAKLPSGERELGERLVYTPQKGAVAYIGATIITYSSNIDFTSLLDEANRGHEYHLGKMLMLEEQTGSILTNDDDLLGDPALHFMGYPFDQTKPDLTFVSNQNEPSGINPIRYTATDNTHGTLTVDVQNLSSIAATNVPIQASIVNDAGTAVNLASGTIPVIGGNTTYAWTNLVTLPNGVTARLHDIRVQINPNKTVTESYYLNNNLTQLQVDTGHFSTNIITVLNGATPVVGAMVVPMVVHGTVYSQRTDTNGQAGFLISDGASVKYEVWTYATNNHHCISVDTGYFTTPNNLTIQLPSASRLVVQDATGAVVNVGAVNVDTLPATRWCSSVPSNEPLYIEAGKTVQFSFTVGSTQYTTPLAYITPATVNFCLPTGKCPAGGGGKPGKISD